MTQLTLEGLKALHQEKDPAPAGPVPRTEPSAPSKPNFRKGSNPEPGREVGTIRRPTKPMVDFVRKLLAERTGNAEADKVRAKLNEWQTKGGLTFASVSWAIDTLKAIPANSEDEEPVRTAPRGRINQYPGVCLDCGRSVAAGEGHLDGKGDDGRWIVRHRDGECQPSDFPFPFGSYALREDDDVVKFYVASEDGLFAKASTDLFPIRNAEHRQQIIDAIAADPKAAAVLYGTELGVCGRCGTELTSKWRLVGIGPVCIKKAGWA